MAASDTVRTGLIGAGGRGTLLAAEFKEIGALVTAVCDVYEPNLAAGLKAASSGAARYDDYRRLLEDKSIDAVIVATPDHWHARMAIDAVEAGKDVYLEKPMAHTIEEGARIVEAVRRTRRIVQVGTQRRSSDLFREAAAIAQSQLGEVHLVNTWWMNSAGALNRRPLEGRLDWARWLGPAPKRELDPVRFRNWYWFWDYSGGMLIGQAAHIVDAIHMLTGSKWATAVTCTSTRRAAEGVEVPDTASIAIEYPEDRLAVFTLSYQAMRYHTFSDQMMQYHGTKARLDVGREAWALVPENRKVLEPAVAKQRREPGSFVPATRSHIRNFLDCVRSRAEPNAPAEVGQQTNVVLCLAMDSLRNGRRMAYRAG
jgi:predicted dehydrogenase